MLGLYITPSAHMTPASSWTNTSVPCTDDPRALMTPVHRSYWQEISITERDGHCSAYGTHSTDSPTDQGRQSAWLIVCVQGELRSRPTIGPFWRWRGMVDLLSGRSLFDHLRHTSDGTDGISAWFLRLTAPCYISRVLSHLINLTLSYSYVPEQQKNVTI